VVLLVSSQGFTYFLQEHINFAKSVSSAQIIHSLIALMYEKSLRLSPATNKKFKPGDLITSC
jgi:hypothetical protein